MEPRQCFDQAEIFQVKRFLHHDAAVTTLLGEELAARFGLEAGPGSQAGLAGLAGLALKLNRGRQSPETFYLADDYSQELARVRAALRKTDARVAELAADRHQEVARRWGIDLTGLEFAIVDAASIGEPAEAARLLSIEPYDVGRVAVRVLPCGEQLELASQRQALAVAERTEETEVMTRLSALISTELPRLLQRADAVGRLDLAFARARLARDCALVRPRLRGTSSAWPWPADAITITGGRLPVIEALCGELGTTYTPLDLGLDGRPAVIFGSNMGGKTVALKTVAFLQLAAQSGLFVPAAAYTTVIVDAIVCVGEIGSLETTRGLSGFGREVSRLSDALAVPGRLLLLFDEFAHTTGSREAEALIGAVAERLAAEGRAQALFSTHFRGVPRSAAVRFLRMRGLRAGGAALLDGARPLAERIADINRHMDYTLVDDDGASRGSDALAIARALGLHPDLVRRATQLLDRSDPKEVPPWRAS